ncbi:RING-H2 finger protein ATL80-like [Phragmites australis]|uniref:RING-H2 finger protein ATL80-like n=1 Tax=Phragmites australis TaxID=29695 RepID=UPI002D785E7C|nr:RING-H2 finger protein ATL80-like [Phragmites australis]
MLNLYPRLRASSVEGYDENVETDGYNAFYGIAVACVSIFLFCVLAASVSVWKALAFAALAAMLLSVAGCFAPKRWFRRSGRPASAELVVTVTAAGAARPGCAFAPENAPPAFVYECPLERDRGEPATASCVLCSVCLEDVCGGEMVRQVPACKHIFHVECIDMWLHSHRTCPMCRCVISPLPKVTPKAATEEAPESSTDELPPV